MEIHYLQNLLNSPIKGDSIIPNDRGVSEEKILALEQNIDVTLPQAFKEFLFLSGEYCLSIEANALNQGLEEYVFRHEQFKENLGKIKLSITRPYYVLIELNQHQFDFIYLDEGDNPPVNNIVIWGDDDFDLEVSANSFSDWIDKEIEIRLNNS